MKSTIEIDDINPEDFTLYSLSGEYRMGLEIDFEGDAQSIDSWDVVNMSLRSGGDSISLDLVPLQDLRNIMDCFSCEGFDLLVEKKIIEALTNTSFDLDRDYESAKDAELEIA